MSASNSGGVSAGQNRTIRFEQKKQCFLVSCAQWLFDQKSFTRVQWTYFCYQQDARLKRYEFQANHNDQCDTSSDFFNQALGIELSNAILTPSEFTENDRKTN